MDFGARRPMRRRLTMAKRTQRVVLTNRKRSANDLPFSGRSPESSLLDLFGVLFEELECVFKTFFSSLISTIVKSVV